MRATTPALSTLAICAALAFAAPVSAADIFNYTNFAGDCNSGQGLTCVGATMPFGSALRLTPATAGTAGAAYSTTAVTLGTGATFSTTFKFRFTDPGGIDPADGIVFVLAASSSGLGTVGYGIGYAGSANNKSVGIEFDTFNDNGNPYSNGNGTLDKSSNHVAIDYNGVLTNADSTNVYNVSDCESATSYSGLAVPTSTQPGCMSNGDLWSVTIGYDGTADLLSVAIQDGALPVDDIITNYSVDLATTLGTNTAFVGFTSGTGAGNENHDILGWQFASDTSLVTPPVNPTPPASGVPEPLPVALFGIGFVGWVASRRRRG